MKTFLDPDYWRAVARNPAALACLAADLAPILAVLFWGWGAAALIVLYWLENVVIGLFVVPRMIVSAVGKHGPVGLIGSAFGVPFFVVHYGMFCAVHGIFLMTMLHSLGQGAASSPKANDMFGSLFDGVFAFAQHMDWMFLVLIAAHGLVFMHDFVLKGGWKESTFDSEMGAPYGRIVILHFGIFLIGGLMFALGDPIYGAVFLVVARAAWGLHTNTKPKRPPAPTSAPQEVPVAG